MPPNNQNMFSSAVHTHSKYEQEVNRVISAKNSSASSMHDWIRKCQDWLQIYNSYRPRPKDSPSTKSARVGTPLGYASVESAHAKMRSTLLPSNPNDSIVKVLPRTYDDLLKAKITEIWLQYAFERAKARGKFSRAMRGFNIFGVSVGFPSWRFLQKKRKLRRPIIFDTPDGGIPLGLGDKETVTQTLFDGPWFEVESPFHCYFDPGAEELTQECMRFICRRRYVPYGQLKAIVESNPEFFDRSEFSKINPENLPTRFRHRHEQGRTTNYYETETSGLQSKNYEEPIVAVDEFYTHDESVFIANEQVRIAHFDSELWSYKIPAVIAVRQPRPGFPFGKSIIEPTEKLITHIDGIRNAAITKANQHLHPPILTRRGSGIDATRLATIGPYDTLEMNSFDDMMTFEYPEIPQEVFSIMGDLRADFDISTAHLGLASGDIPSNIRSYSQQESALELVNERNRSDIDDFGEDFIVQMGEFFIELANLYMTDPIDVRVSGLTEMTIKSVSPVDLLGQYDLKLASASRTLPKAIEATNRQIFLNTISAILQNPQGMPDAIVMLYAELAADYGFTKEETALRKLLPELTARRFFAEGNLVPPISGANQANQGNIGAILGGAGTNALNTPSGGITSPGGAGQFLTGGTQG